MESSDQYPAVKMPVSVVGKIFNPKPVLRYRLLSEIGDEVIEMLKQVELPGNAERGSRTEVMRHEGEARSEVERMRNSGSLAARYLV